MAGPVQLQEHPLQPLANLMKQILCAVQDLKKSIDNLASVGDNQQLTITTTPPRTDNVAWDRVVVTTTPTRIRSANSNRLNLSLVNSGGATVYLGTTDSVTDLTGDRMGYELLSNGTWDTQTYTGALYGVVAAGSVTLTFWEESL